MTNEADLTMACLRTLIALNDFLAVSLRYLSSSLPSRLAKALIGSSVDERSAALNAALTNFDRVLQHTVNLIVLQETQDEIHQELLDSLSPLSISEFQAEQDVLMSKSCAGTGDWFLNADKVSGFLKGEVPWLWCQGQGTCIAAIPKHRAN